MKNFPPHLEGKKEVTTRNAPPSIVALLILALSGAAVFGAPAPAADEKAVIEKVIRDNIGWALTKDRPLAESTMVHDESLFIFNPNSEATIGWSRLVKNFEFWMDPRFKALECEIWDMRIHISRSGDVAWWSCMLNDLGEWDGRPTGWKDTRWTGVMEKRDGKWLIVQMHFSFASESNAASLGGPYLGQTPPGGEGKLFAPGFISTGLDEGIMAMAPDGNECFWPVVFSGTETIVTSRFENGRWTKPDVAPFSGQYFDGWPAFHPDGKRLFFHSARPVPTPAYGKPAQVNVWYVDRTAGCWSEPRP